MNAQSPAPTTTEREHTARDAVAMCADLLRINTCNDGEHPERPAAEYVAARLEEVGLAATLTESAPGRASVLARLPGSTDAPALLVHAHLDTVPADACEWSVDPYSGEVRDDCLWGRGAIDMKDMVAMSLAVARSYARTGRSPHRDIVFAFVADEESGGEYGARHLVTRHRDQLADCTEAIGEIGAFSCTLPDGRRLYPIQIGEKGVHWIRVSARRGPGRPNPVLTVSEAITRMATHSLPRDVPAASRAFLDALSLHTGRDLDPSRPRSIDELRALLPTFAPMAALDFTDTAAPTIVTTSPVRPGHFADYAQATIDGRFLPGHAQSFDTLMRDLAGPDVHLEVLRHSPAVETAPEGEFYHALQVSLRSADSEAVTAPYLLSAGTDAKWFAGLGMRCYGFSPLRLPEAFDYAGMFHGVDERVPLSALAFGTEVLDHLFATAPATTPTGDDAKPAAGLPEPSPSPATSPPERTATTGADLLPAETSGAWILGCR
ncbi:M20/M25/M40 family metallo-hydrolase [Streptomyces sp. SID3343]|uniref:M20/M25/M40 family metallo-hydrolase n=1 Tax=Streptomyces sp. SID3343 TaxID=2690260 RepID=UPI00136ECA67|nr:M20/M25/M40 family metallo-hydrolase [Streptomyces sp. SID3343]MYW04952.1 M20/M25/M40 family metallo-hydrolase [Streptomyces sp. SID3343]